MRFLADTHILVWALTNDKKLSEDDRSLLYDTNNEIYYSPLLIYEVDLKHSKHPKDMPVSGIEIVAFCEEAGFKVLPLTEKHTLQVKNLQRYENTPPHNDPFDKMMLCQAVAENMLFMTHDNRIAEYDCLNVYKI